MFQNIEEDERLGRIPVGGALVEEREKDGRGTDEFESEEGWRSGGALAVRLDGRRRSEDEDEEFEDDFEDDDEEFEDDDEAEEDFDEDFEEEGDLDDDVEGDVGEEEEEEL